MKSMLHVKRPWWSFEHSFMLCWAFLCFKNSES